MIVSAYRICAARISHTVSRLNILLTESLPWLRTVGVTITDLWSHHRAVLVCLAVLGGTAPLWKLAFDLRTAGEDVAGLRTTVLQLAQNGWVRLQGEITLTLADCHLELTESGRRLTSAEA